MRTIKLACVASAAAVAIASTAGAAVIGSDDFTAADGTTLAGRTPAVGGPWTTFSGTTGQLTINNGSVTLVQGTQSEDISLPFTAGNTAAAGSVLYSGFDLTVPAFTGTTITDGYFGLFLAGTSSFDGRVWITAPTTSGFRLALSNDNSITDGDGEVRSADLAFGTTYRVITSYDFSAKTSTLWINPVDASSPSLAATDPGFSDAVTAYAFREASGNTSQTIDNVLLGTTFADVLSAGTVTPEPASLTALGGAMLVGLVRRRSR